MRHIRTKLVLSILVITLLPVLPLYYLVEGLLDRSLGIGFNVKVESALENASQFSQELYAVYKQETLATVESWAESDEVRNALLKKRNTIVGLMSSDRPSVVRKIELYDHKTNLLASDASSGGHAFPPIYQTSLKRLTQDPAPGFLEGALDASHISAFAPVTSGGRIIGYLVLTRFVGEDFKNASEEILEVHQMFKTLSFVRDDLKRGFLFSFFVVYAPIAALSIAVGYYFSRKITSPLLELADGTKRVAQGDWDYRMQVTSKDEVGQLVLAFNQMIANLKEKQDQVIALEKMAVWREIARVLAHEIKNPLTPIQLTVQQLKDKYPGENAEYQHLLQECVEIVSEEIESLRKLVREFSEFARMPKLSLSPGNLNELIAEVRKFYCDRPMDLELNATLPEFEFDYEKLRRLLINLVENGFDSIKQKGSGRIVVRTDFRNDKALLNVSDDGMGIPKELQAKIFEPYFSTKKSGMGLGLAVVKRVVEEHNGTITVESVAGHGTTFYIELPISR